MVTTSSKAEDSITTLTASAGVQMMYAFPFLFLEGVSSVTLDVALPRNALVDDFKCLVRARRVDSTQVQQVAQVRSYASAAGNELVIDFGTPRTVSGVDLPGGVDVLAVFAWLGSQFSSQSAYFRSAGGNPAPGPNALFPELRTERLRVLISAPLSSTALAEVRLRLPEPPSGLELRIDGGPVVWSHPEPVQPRGAVSTPDGTGWNKDSERIVTLTDAMAALAGDPLADDAAASFKLTLTTKVPCDLRLTLQGTPAWRRIRRVRFGDETATTLAFAGEGAAELPLALPAPPAGATRRIDALRWVAAGDLPPWRALPPLGPDAAAGGGEPVLAELLVDTERAVCVALSGGSGLAELTGVRLPLRALGDGAEARVVLWSVPAEGSALPLEPLPQGASQPLTLAAGDTEAWCSFDFAQPVPVDPLRMPWLALNLARGEVAWALARPSGLPGDPVDAQLLRRGPPNGPWKALPAPLQAEPPAGVLAARGRLRLVGLAPKDAPLAPLTLALDGQAATDLVPNAKGVSGSMSFPTGVTAATPLLRLVCRSAGSVTLRDIDVTSSN